MHLMTSGLPFFLDKNITSSVDDKKTLKRVSGSYSVIPYDLLHEETMLPTEIGLTLNENLDINCITLRLLEHEFLQRCGGDEHIDVVF